MTARPDLRLAGIALLAALALPLAAQPATAQQAKSATAAPTAAYVFQPVQPAQQAAQPLQQPKPANSYQFRPLPAPVASDRAQDDRAKGKLKDGIYALKGDYYFSYAENAWRIVTGPLRYDAGDWLNVAIVAGITGGLMALDETIRDFSQDDVRSSTGDDISDAIYYLGSTKPLFYTGVGSYALFELLDMKREKAASLMALESLILTALLTEGIKTATSRERPNESDSAYDYLGVGSPGDNSAFPSGHASNAFAVASVIAEVYGDDNPWVPWASYGLASGVALSRVNDNKHWASDVFLGSALGLFIGKMVVRYNPFLEEQGIALKPFAADGAKGVAMSMKF